MGAEDSLDLAWRTSQYGAVHAALTRLLDAGNRPPPPGAEGAIGRARLHFQAAGDFAALALLDAISVAFFRYLNARRDRDRAAMSEASRRLAALAHDWLIGAPMFPAAPTGRALAA